MRFSDLHPLDQALTRWRAALAEIGALQPLPAETIPTAQALGRVTAAAVWARLSVPHYHAVAMDGYAVRSQQTQSATPLSPLRLRVGQDVFYVNTGDPLPPGCDAVIPQEDAQVHAQDLLLTHPVPAWQHIRLLGEDIVATELVIPAHHRLRPQDLGAILGSGHHGVRVFRRPRIALLPLGQRLVPASPHVGPGQIIEFNSTVLAAMAETWGAQAITYPPLAPDLDITLEQVRVALEDHDLVVLNAGAAGGARDRAASIIAHLGHIVVQGVALRPGHAVILGHALGKPIAAIPGFPVSAITAFEQIVHPLLEAWHGQSYARPPHIRAMVAQSIPSDPQMDEFVRVTVAHTYRGKVARPLPRGAGAIMSMVRADGVVHIPRGQAEIPASSQVEVALLRPHQALPQTILHIGSHDLALDILADQLRRAHPTRYLNSLHVGSEEGLRALARGEAHFAGVHLLDPDTGEYNRPAVKRHLAHVPVVILPFLIRVQGLLVAAGNPKNIQSLADLVRPDVRFVNRQAGSGTRVLLDYHLQRLGLDPAQIQGYQREEHSHLAVAAAVAHGAADVGLGILAAARALDLDFIPLFREPYDLVMPRAHYESDLLAPLLDLIHSDHFRHTVIALGGYEPE